MTKTVFLMSRLFLLQTVLWIVVWLQDSTAKTGREVRFNIMKNHSYLLVHLQSEVQIVAGCSRNSSTQCSLCDC